MSSIEHYYSLADTHEEQYITNTVLLEEQKSTTTALQIHMMSKSALLQCCWDMRRNKHYYSVSGTDEEQKSHTTLMGV